MVSTCARNSFWILQKWQIKKPTHSTIYIYVSYASTELLLFSPAWSRLESNTNMDAGFWLPSAHVRFHKTETHIKYQTHGVVNDPRCVSTKRTREDSIPMYSLCLVHDTVLRKRAALAVNEHFPVCSVCGKTSLLYLH